MLSCSAEQQALGVGDQRAEVGHCADAHKDQRRIDAELNAQVQDIDQAEIMPALPCNGTVGKEFGVIQVRAREVRQQHTERNR